MKAREVERKILRASLNMKAKRRHNADMFIGNTEVFAYLIY